MRGRRLGIAVLASASPGTLDWGRAGAAVALACAALLPRLASGLRGAGRVTLHALAPASFDRPAFLSLIGAPPRLRGEGARRAGEGAGAFALAIRHCLCRSFPPEPNGSRRRIEQTSAAYSDVGCAGITPPYPPLARAGGLTKPAGMCAPHKVIFSTTQHIFSRNRTPPALHNSCATSSLILLERIAQIAIELAEQGVSLVVLAFGPAVDPGGLHDSDRRVAGFGHGGKPARPDLGQQGRAEGGPFGRIQAMWTSQP